MQDQLDFSVLKNLTSSLQTSDDEFGFVLLEDELLHVGRHVQVERLANDLIDFRIAVRFVFLRMDIGVALKLFLRKEQSLQEKIDFLKSLFRKVKKSSNLSQNLQLLFVHGATVPRMEDVVNRPLAPLIVEQFADLVSELLKNNL